MNYSFFTGSVCKGLWKSQDYIANLADCDLNICGTTVFRLKIGWISKKLRFLIESFGNYISPL
jgi:hypothetical protein